MTPRPPSARLRNARLVASVATVVAICCTGAAAVLASASGAEGGGARTPGQERRLDAARSAAGALNVGKSKVPLARGNTCAATKVVPGQGRSCRTPDGMYLAQAPGGIVLPTHGPDLVAATTARRGRAGGFGTPASVLCAAPSRTRYVVLAYLLPADFASGTPGLHGDRYAEVAPQLRQSLYDAAALVDATAGELVPGARRRMRVQCDADGQPTVLRVVLPHTAARYRTSTGGFGLIGDDLDKLGLLPKYEGFTTRRVASVRRLLGYYDADFNEGYAGQGTMYRRSSLVATGAVKGTDPLVSRTTRNINNNPPQASLAIQYGTATGGVPDPPLYTSLLHELTHSMGAVQNEPRTASDAGHCLDGLDLMCYDDGGPAGPYRADVCPDLAPPFAPEDERFDCNGDTYFHPAPPVGSPLASPTTWHLGLPANETLSTSRETQPTPTAVTRVTTAGIGTKLALRWPAVPPLARRTYDVAYRPVGGNWAFLTSSSTTAHPPLKPFTTYEFAVGAVSPDGVVGPRATVTRRTGRDNTPPTRPGAARLAGVSATSARLEYVPSSDNVRVVSYRIERLAGRRWVLARLVPAPRIALDPAAGPVRTPAVSGLARGTTYRFRMVARDAAGNSSLASRTVTATTGR